MSVATTPRSRKGSIDVLTEDNRTLRWCTIIHEPQVQV